MYALIKNNAVERYPYTPTDLKRDNPSVSFPRTPDAAAMAPFGVQIVFNNPPPTVTNQQVLEEGTPVFSQDTQRWEQVWVVRSKTADELATEIENKSIEVRSERDFKLAETDWVTIRAMDAGTVVSDEWATYRQALRDITLQEGFPLEVIWPEKP